MQKIGIIAGEGFEIMRDVIENKVSQQLEEVVSDRLLFHINNDHPHPALDKLSDTVYVNTSNIGKLKRAVNFKEEDETIYVIFDGGTF